MSRWKAAGIHLGISLIIAILIGSMIYFVWYPPPYFTVAGGSTLILLIMGVDVVIGPCLTLAVFRTGKRGLKFDLGVIAILQFVAFCYGLSVITAARPVFLVAEMDRFVPVSAYQLEDADLAKASRPEFSTRSWTGPRLVGAVLPKGDTSDLTISALAGKDIDKLPKYYVPYNEAVAALLAHAHPISALKEKAPQLSAEIDRLIAQSEAPATELVYVPLEGRVDSYTMVLSKRTGQPLGVLAFDPW
ncbi:MAG: pilus assembly protein [Gammaproteobacteria bacterium]|nr:MAG: pilus assembly protein [Gammaproteobacteria bacterium]